MYVDSCARPLGLPHSLAPSPPRIRPAAHRIPKGPSEATPSMEERPPPAPGPAAAEDPVERLLLSGPERLTPPELLAVVLGRSARPDARRAACALLERFPSLRRASCATFGEMRQAGLAKDDAARLLAAFALGRRAGVERFVKGAPFRASRDIYDRFHPVLRDLRKERFVAVLLDGKNQIMREERISEGILTSSLVHPREAFGPALREAAGAMVFVHNHPSGDPEPSQEDHDITRRLCASGELLGISVLDHVVIGDGAYVSFLDRGWIAR